MSAVAQFAPAEGRSAQGLARVDPVAAGSRALLLGLTASGPHSSECRTGADPPRRQGLKVWAEALDDGDELAQQLFDTAVEKLGVAIGSTVNLLDLDRVVIGGGLAEKLGQSLADRLLEESRPWMLQPSPDLEFVVSELGDDAGVVGAAVLARAAVAGGGR